MKRSSPWVLLLLIVILFSCNKRLILSFTLSDSTPDTFQEIKVTDVNDAKEYKWFVDGAFYSNEKQPSFIFTTPGQHEIKLESRTGINRWSTSSRGFMVKSVARVVFWQKSNNFTVPLRIIVNQFSFSGNSVKGDILTGHNSEPVWGSAGCANLLVPKTDTIYYSAFADTTSIISTYMGKAAFKDGYMAIEVK